jgi:uncharacterized protein
MLPFVFILVIALVLLWLGLGYWMANALLYPPRRPIVRTPADAGLPFEEVTFSSKDHLLLKGWWIPAVKVADPSISTPVVIMLHPLFGNRHGLVRRPSDWRYWPFRLEGELDLLQTAKQFSQAGYAVLMFDFRSHGESQRGLCGGGLSEDQDVMGAVDYVLARVTRSDVLEPQTTEKPSVGVVAYGLGAAAALAAIGREKGGAEIIRVFSGDGAGGSGFVTIPPLNVKYLRFLVAIQPASAATLLKVSLHPHVRFWGWILIPLVEWFCQTRGGYPLGVDALLKASREVHLPVFYAQSTSAPALALNEAQAIYNVLPRPKAIWWLEEAYHPLGNYCIVANDPAPMFAFVARQMQSEIVLNPLS